MSKYEHGPTTVYWQDVDDDGDVPEPAIVVHNWSNVIEIQQGDNSILVSFGKAQKELAKIIAKAKSGQS